MCKYSLQNEFFLVFDLINEMSEIEIYKSYPRDRKVYEFMYLVCVTRCNKFYTSARLIFTLYVRILDLILSVLSAFNFDATSECSLRKIASYSSRCFELSNKSCTVQKSTTCCHLLDFMSLFFHFLQFSLVPSDSNTYEILSTNIYSF